ncbi:PREDICTED: LOW QUALITY PROTEIN: uncharacterized protein LOC105363331 [Ceratosolen solmsi marchali]|uniref:LOW QUALITY PROTEIN: uncharacterized protein LOC105363331 n=1 Tax=Ceratosolen solmsi marchali TaxID=326594 RepID=A0AAJ6YJN6_9HYME|nr:PREDICTED: LOW QUALITY PROTEIN: uncharacterized protein LOC105363331 [Ceratosolen solmsi marchali]
MALLKCPRIRQGLAAVLLIVSMTRAAATQNSEMASIMHRPIRAISYPSSSNMGIFFALAVPLEDPLKSVSLSYFFEANYGLPSTQTLSAWRRRRAVRRAVWRVVKRVVMRVVRRKCSRRRRRRRRVDKGRRSIDRSTVYAVLQSKFESAGFPGHECLLRSICEASEYPLEHNGMLGDIFHIVFSPSSSRPEDHLPDGIIEAELKGRNGTCFDYYMLCPLGLFDLIGILR